MRRFDPHSLGMITREEAKAAGVQYERDKHAVEEAIDKLNKLHFPADPKAPIDVRELKKMFDIINALTPAQQKQVKDFAHTFNQMKRGF